MPLPTRHSIDTNFKKGGSLGVIEQLDLTTSLPQTVAILDGSGNQISAFGLITVPFNYIGVTYPDTSTEVYTYKSGGSGGTTVGVITLAFSDAVTKNILLSVTKT